MTRMEMLERTDKFVDYFAICGLDLKSGLEPHHFAGENQLHNTPLDRSYKCKVLIHYPESVSWNPFDHDALCTMSLPNGLRFKTQKHDLEPEFHSFIVTKQNGERCYGHSLVFYEKAPNKICSAMQTLQAMHLTELSGGPKKNNSNYNTRSLPRHFKMMSQQFRLVQSYYDVANDVLHVSKSIFIVSQYLYVHASYQFLMNLYKCWKEKTPISLESYIYYLLHDVKVPAPGHSFSFFINADLNVTITTPDFNELPLFDFAMREVFYLLDVDSLLYLFTSVLLENQVLICSSNYQHLMLVAETISCLLFPFAWPHVYVPILPTSLAHFLDAPVPFIMGITRNACMKIPSESNLCFLDIDNQTIQLPEELLTFPDVGEFTTDIINLLDQYNIPIRNSFRLIRSTEIRHASRRSDVGAKMSMSSENLSFALSNEDKLSFKGSSDYLCSNFENLDSSTALNSIVEDYVLDQCFNAVMRELFLHKFLHLFISYERFIIQPFKDQDQWLSNKESTQNFDKVSFLADHPDHHAFLSQFIETQMFTNFIDNKIQSFWTKKESLLNIFDLRIEQLLKKHDEVEFTNCSFETCSQVNKYQSRMKERDSMCGTQINPPEEIYVNMGKPQYNSDSFPSLNLALLNKFGTNRSNKKSRLTGDGSSDPEVMVRSASEAYPLGTGERLTIVKSSQNNSPRRSPAMIAQTNWNFVDKLLKDCKTRTKKMLIAKMGYEAGESGPRMNNMLIEENALIIGLCDLLERIWSHGCQNKQGKSALWFHLKKYKEIEEVNELEVQTQSMLLNADACLLNSVSVKTNMPIQDEESSVFVLQRLRESLIDDMKFVQTLTDIKTPVGLAKAWVRLSLEKKLLSRHLKSLLSNSVLLKNMYKRYAFLRCDEEKEQFLFHLLSLNAVDYYCFTNTYFNCHIPYRILIHSSTKIASSMTSNCWIILSGHIGETEKISIPKGKLEFVFEYKNLGLLTLLRIGQENKNFSLKWLVDWVIVRNEITGHVYNFPCGRWLGRGVDDDSSERLLIGKRISESGERGRNITTTRIRSPSVPPMRSYITDSEIQQHLGESVNNIIKFFYGKPEESASIATLLCGENGLVFHLERALLFGFRSSRLFGRNLHVWDFIVKAKEEFCLTKENEDEEVYYFSKLVTAVENASDSVGREGRFQVFVCVTIRDHAINSVLRILSRSKVVSEMYEEHSFLRKKSLFYFLIQLLDSLYDHEIFLENCLTLGITIE